MLIIMVLGAMLIQVASNENGEAAKPYIVVQVPVEMPNRNDRSNQCWLRVEDVEVTAMITVYCFISHDFLETYINEYNKRKMEEDRFNDTRWNDEFLRDDKCYPTNYELFEKGHKMTTLLDTITRKRIYVSKSADCKLIMYSREGTTNYNVDCQKLLYYFNCRSTSSANTLKNNLVVIVGLILWAVCC